MIWGILYFICAVIDCGIILCIDEYDTDFTVFCSLFWPVHLIFFVLYGLGHCVRLLLTKIIKTK